MTDEAKQAKKRPAQRPAAQAQNVPFWVQLNNAARNPSARSARRAASSTQRRNRGGRR